MSFLIEGQKISILEPKQESINRVKTIARQIGDSKISGPDISVISLAIDYGVQLCQMTIEFATWLR